MRPITTEVLEKLKIADSLVRVARTQRNLVPSEPGWEQLTVNNATITRVERYIKSLCRGGMELATERELTARKPGHGVRPVAFWGIKEQVLYDALTAAALQTLPVVDRSVAKYIEFIESPVSYAREIQPDKKTTNANKVLFFVFDSEVKYVVKSDLTSFYQFIDHSILADELISQGADFDIVSHLIDLISEVTGRPLGLPQLYHASDRLSEVYIDQVERALLRKGFAVWRFNDDFRIACKNFSEAIAAIEALDSAARSVGLAINELKTFTYQFSTYFLSTYDIDKLPEGGIISLDDVEAAAGDYTDDFSEAPDSALAFIQSTNLTGENDGLDLKNADRDDVRRIRRALDSLAQDQNAEAFDSIELLISFVPSLTPDLIKYMMAAGSGDHRIRAGEILDSIIESVSLNSWQQVWLIEALRALDLLSDADPSSIASRLTWVQKCFATGKEPLRGAAFWALAASSNLEVVETVAEAMDAPEAVKSLYLAGVRDRLPINPTMQEGNAVSGLRETDDITRALLAS